MAPALEGGGVLCYKVGGRYVQSYEYSGGYRSRHLAGPGCTEIVL